MKKLSTICLLALFQHLSSSVFAQVLYTQTGTDVTWQYILDNNLIPTNQTSYAGITGSTIDVNQNHPAISSSPYKNRAIQNNISIHTLGNASVPRADFSKWSRWYQEDGNTQILRLFQGEYNVRNDRTPYPRIEVEAPNYLDNNAQLINSAQWAEWSGTYTVVTAIKCTIFQIWGYSASKPAGSGLMMLELNWDGSVEYNPRDGSGFMTMVTNAVGKSFNIRVRDYGDRYEIYLNDVLFVSKALARTGGCHFRWGMYMSDNVPYDCMILFTGAQIAFGVNGNTPPTLSPIAAQTIFANTNTGPLAFTVSDDSTPVGSISLNKSSSNTNLIPAANIVFGGSGSNRTVTVTPATNQTGSAIVSLIASDGSLSSTNSFTLTVQPTGAVFVSVTNNTAGTLVWICPPGVTSVKVECWGGGGAGGAASKSVTNNATGGGGGGGAYARKASVPVTPGNTYPLIIPAAATAPVGSASDLQRFDGSNVTFTGDGGVVVTAAGGQGGQSKISTAPGHVSGLGGAGGAASGCVGDVGGVFAGGLGGNAGSSPSGGGGGGAGDANPGDDSPGQAGGIGGGNGGGNGGAGRTGAGGGNPGLPAGGGGAGAKAQNAGSSRDGGIGGLGQIILTYLQAPVERPVLGHNLSGGNLVLSWSGSGFKTQVCTNLNSAVWSDVPGGNVSPVNIAPSLPAAYYRLTQQ